MPEDVIVWVRDYDVDTADEVGLERDSDGQCQISRAVLRITDLSE